MNAFTTSRGRAHWVALVALAALTVGVGVAAWQARPVRSPAFPPRATGLAPAEEPGEQVIEQALRQAPVVPGPRPTVDSTAFKQRWLDDVRGIEVAGLDAAQLERFVRFANARLCTCGCGYTLAGCKASDMTCETSGELLEALRDSIAAGWITRARGVRARPTK